MPENQDNKNIANYWCILQGFFYNSHRFNLSKKMWNKTLAIFIFVISLNFSVGYASERVVVAVASNFLAPFKKIKVKFKEETGYDLLISSGSTAKLYAQIKNGAPFDIFLSADQLTTNKLINENKAIKESEFVYAAGQLAFWDNRKNSDQVVTQNTLIGLKIKPKDGRKPSRLAIANPKLAPYGRAAFEVLQKLKLDEIMLKRLVFGENIGQAFQFVYSKNADFGIVALSQLKIKGIMNGFWVIPQNLYQPIHQSAILLNRAKNNLTANAFMAFLKRNDIQKLIVSDYGYQLIGYDLP